MGRRKRKNSPQAMWLTWLAIVLIVAGILLDFAYLFTDGFMLMYLGAGCTVIGILSLVAQTKLSNSR